MKLNTNSNIYTFVYMTVVVIIVAVLLEAAGKYPARQAEADPRCTQDRLFDRRSCRHLYGACQRHAALRRTRGLRS